jgi:hypothetical protein
VEGDKIMKVDNDFTDARNMLSKKLGLYTRIAIRIVNNKKRTVILHQIKQPTL